MHGGGPVQSVWGLGCHTRGLEHKRQHPARIHPRKRAEALAGTLGSSTDLVQIVDAGRIVLGGAADHGDGDTECLLGQQPRTAAPRERAEDLQRLRPARLGAADAAAGAEDAAGELGRRPAQGAGAQGGRKGGQRAQGGGEDLRPAAAGAPSQHRGCDLEGGVGGSLPVWQVFRAQTPRGRSSAHHTEGCHAHAFVDVPNAHRQRAADLRIVLVQPSPHGVNEGRQQFKGSTLVDLRVPADQPGNKLEQLLPHPVPVHGHRLAECVACLAQRAEDRGLQAGRVAFEQGRLQPRAVPLGQVAPKLRQPPREHGCRELPAAWSRSVMGARHERCQESRVLGPGVELGLRLGPKPVVRRLQQGEHVVHLCVFRASCPHGDLALLHRGPDRGDTHAHPHN
mmetsp:Transcript_29886/g.93423  ORF Transcript_29886/g.93423 Transcript_29886/m.93423 type:complete len:396 (+) Transcript_29886:1369-2556(+)